MIHLVGDGILVRTPILSSLSIRANEVFHYFWWRIKVPVANEIQAGLTHDCVVATVWTNGVFGASKFSLEALEDARSEADFAVLVLYPDDKVISRQHELDAPRDNIIFELGFFIGALGRRRVFIVSPRSTEIKIPTDLLGITPITYAHGDPKDLAAHLGPVCTELRKTIEELGPR